MVSEMYEVVNVTDNKFTMITLPLNVNYLIKIKFKKFKFKKLQTKQMLKN